VEGRSGERREEVMMRIRLVAVRKRARGIVLASILCVCVCVRALLLRQYAHNKNFQHSMGLHSQSGDWLL
jgi:hypothetical protein